VLLQLSNMAWLALACCSYCRKHKAEFIHYDACMASGSSSTSHTESVRRAKSTRPCHSAACHTDECRLKLQQDLLATDATTGHTQ
jgi:hypothetical protein